MKCEVCGLEYGLSHNCPGPLTAEAQSIVAAELQVPANAGLGYYLGEALKIVRWDDAAVRRNAKDAKATWYGLLFWLASCVLILAVTILLQPRPMLLKTNPAALAVGLLVGLVFGVIVMAIITFLQLGLCHGIAKLLFGATGKLSEVMRPLLLGWFVNCFSVIPVIGMFVAAIGWTAVLMISFEEVDGIERLQAFGISAGINVCFLVLQFLLMPARPF